MVQMSLHQSVLNWPLFFGQRMIVSGDGCVAVPLRRCLDAANEKSQGAL
jgi:hypothetical protein